APLRSCCGSVSSLRSSPTRRSSDLPVREALRELESLRLIETVPNKGARVRDFGVEDMAEIYPVRAGLELVAAQLAATSLAEDPRSEEHTSELQSRFDLVCRLLLEKK